MSQSIMDSGYARWSALAFDSRAVATIVGAAALGAILAVAASFLMPRLYSANVILLPAKSERTAGLGAVAGELGGLASLAGIELGSDDDKSEALATLRSRSLGMAFIDQRHLMTVILSNQWDASAGRWRSRDPDDVPTLADAYRRFDRKIRSVSEDRRTGIVTLTITTSDRNMAADWANELTARVNREMRARAIREAQKSLDYLYRELDKTQVVELRQPIYRVIENRINTVMLANVREQYAFRIIDPAVPPDDDDHSSPLRWLYALAGLVVGALIGAVVALRRSLKKRHVN